MAREIKFRGQILHHDLIPNPKNCWVKGYYFQDETSSFIFQPPYNWEVVPETVGQFTGLLDKNGKEIYEGDVIEIKEIGGYGCKRKGIVEYDVNDCAFVVRVLRPNWADIVRLSTRVQICADGKSTLEYFNQYTVIGNIHDNPELLKKKHYETK